ncbi:unnamed protein product [Phyllotreta striolata]|uniref:Uncharacterized protein n=1 Tax=Phyllotreta striolata TaxID=444603 RepID=A0A9N9TXF4_PHYSR|nr:unnamed protein product [Phyllotreta striolata]
MGLGRSGVMVAIYLMYFHGMSAERAIFNLRYSRPGSLDSECQEECVLNYRPAAKMANEERLRRITSRGEHFLSFLKADERSDFSQQPSNFSWIVEDQLAAMAFPNSLANLEYLYQNNIKHLITLSDDFVPPVDEYKKIEWTLIPVEEFRPPSLEDIETFMGICQESFAKNQAVGVHCRQGRGRTGVMAACFLVKYQNLHPEKAITKISHLLLWSTCGILAIHPLENPSLCTSRNSDQLERFCMCDDLPVEPKCQCTGPELVDVPANLTKNLEILVIEDAECLEVLKSDSLNPHSRTLRELTLANLEKFYYFESGVFHQLKQLQTLYIQRAPKLLKIQPDVFRTFLPRLKILDLEHNHIKEIQTRQVSNVRAEQLLLNFNDIRVVEEAAFAGSEIANLSLKGNFRLRLLHKRAFAGLQSLRYIDLSGTAITFLPIEGLREIDTLKIQNTKSLKVFPSVFNFQFLKEAWLTYPYHCCAFKFPRTHNPWEYEKHVRFIKELQSACNTKNTTSNKDLNSDGFHNWLPANLSVNTEVQSEEFWGEEHEVFHNASNDEFFVKTAYCGELSRNYHEIKCDPIPDAFNPCEDLMGNWGLRVPVWFISFSAVIGNLFVVIVIATSHFRLTVSKFLMCNLAIADLCIGIHLLLTAAVDACSIGAYFNSAIDWQEGNGCNVAGFLTIFGNILSVYTLTVITTERWYTITWAIHLNKRLKLRNAVKVMIAGWICAVFMATLPLLGVSSYSKTSICLPLENKGKADTIYLSTLLAFNAVAFGLICVCYGSMYKSIREEFNILGGRTGSTTSVRSDFTVAKRMALLVFTDFACWAPIAFFGITALLGFPLITVTHTKILLVFFYPLNSCANPCLYALLTQQYRRDFFILMGRYGLCKDRAERHKGAIGGKPLPYGSGLQYKKTYVEGGMKTGGANRASTMTSMTTVVSVECSMRTSSRNNSSRYRPESGLALADFSVKNNANNFHECHKCVGSDNL